MKRLGATKMASDRGLLLIVFLLIYLAFVLAPFVFR